MPRPLTLLVIAKPNARFLRVLERLPPETNLAVGNNLDAFASAAPGADVILSCVGSGLPLEAVWRIAPRVRWVHSMAAGVENTLFPELAASDVPLTNSRGVFARSLAEFAIAAMLFFAKDLRAMVRNQEAGVWRQFDVEELQGKTLGIVGYGQIGRATAERARVFGVRIAAFRRRPELSSTDALVDESYGPGELRQLLGSSDYAVVAAALTPETRAMIGAGEIAAMKNTAVLINLGRGPVIVEGALIDALRDHRIRGAALDVFDTEPLPAGHPFYSLDNVLLSPHCADHTPTWQEDAMEFFVGNFQRFSRGEPLHNVVDKSKGY